MKLDANALFEDELSRRGIRFEKLDADSYRIRIHGVEVTANLTNVRRNAERDGDADVARRFVDHVLRMPRGTPEWEAVRGHLFFSAEAADQDLGDAIRTPVSLEVCRVLTWTDPEQTAISWVTAEMCETWGVSPEQATSLALTNQDTLLSGIEIQIAEARGEKLGMVPTASPYKASVFFAGAFKPFVERTLGWPVLVVIPCRDFLYVLPDGSPLLGQMGEVVVKEHRSSGYPITTEVLRVSDEGVRAIGRFPT